MKQRKNSKKRGRVDGLGMSVRPRIARMRILVTGAQAQKIMFRKWRKMK